MLGSREESDVVMGINLPHAGIDPPAEWRGTEVCMLWRDDEISGGTSGDRYDSAALGQSMQRHRHRSTVRLTFSQPGELCRLEIVLSAGLKSVQGRVGSTFMRV